MKRHSFLSNFDLGNSQLLPQSQTFQFSMPEVPGRRARCANMANGVMCKSSCIKTVLNVFTMTWCWTDISRVQECLFCPLMILSMKIYFHICQPFLGGQQGSTFEAELGGGTKRDIAWFADEYSTWNRIGLVFEVWTFVSNSRKLFRWLLNIIYIFHIFHIWVSTIDIIYKKLKICYITFWCSWNFWLSVEWCPQEYFAT